MLGATQLDMLTTVYVKAKSRFPLTRQLSKSDGNVKFSTYS